MLESRLVKLASTGEIWESTEGRRESTGGRWESI